MHPKPGSGLSYSITNSFTYNLTWNKVYQATDGNGNVTTFTYAPSGAGASRLMQVQSPPVPAGTAVANFAYNTIGQLITATDPTGVQTSLTYDPLSADLLTVVVDSRTGGLNITTSYTYDAVGIWLQSKIQMGTLRPFFLTLIAG